MKNILLSFFLIVSSGVAVADDSRPPTVLTSIPPLHSLVKGVVGDSGEVVLLLGNASPHHAILTPSQIRHLQRPGLLFYIGGGFESFLQKALPQTPDSLRKVAMIETPGLSVLPYRDFHEDGHDEHDEHGHDDHDEHGHDDHDEHGHDDHDEHGHDDHDEHGHDEHGHEHGEEDLHIWLDPNNAIKMVEAIRVHLSAAHPSQEEVYRRNAVALVDRLQKLDRRLTETLEGLEGRRYWVFHDAYQYFERRYHLDPAGAIAVNPEVPLSAKRMADIRRRMSEQSVRCLFSEPQFSGRSVRALADDLGLKYGVLDPLGYGREPTADLYFQVLEGLADGVNGCLR